MLYMNTSAVNHHVNLHFCNITISVLAVAHALTKLTHHPSIITHFSEINHTSVKCSIKHEIKHNSSLQIVHMIHDS